MTVDKIRTDKTIFSPKTEITAISHSPQIHERERELTFVENLAIVDSAGERESDLLLERKINI